MTVDDRYSRNTALFGREGQAKVAATPVTLVGLGGLGGHVAQQLAYLGVANFSLIDFDVVTESSLNRLVGAEDSDVASAAKKIKVAERLIHRVNPVANVELIDDRIASPDAEAAVAAADVVFGCLDRDLARLDLIRACAKHARPLFDLASDVGGQPDDLWYGGRLVLCDGTRCPVCLELLDQAEMARDAMSPDQRAAHDRIYGVDRSALDGSGPMVVSINGVVASLAITEFIALVTGLRSPIGYLTYRADLQTVRRSLDPPVEGCYYCQALWGSALDRA